MPARPETVLGVTGTHMQVEIPVQHTCHNGNEATGAALMAVWKGPQDPTVTVDVWILDDGGRLLLLTKAVRGNPSPAQLEALEDHCEVDAIGVGRTAARPPSGERLDAVAGDLRETPKQAKTSQRGLAVPALLHVEPPSGRSAHATSTPAPALGLRPLGGRRR